MCYFHFDCGVARFLQIAVLYGGRAHENTMYGSAVALIVQDKELLIAAQKSSMQLPLLLKTCTFILIQCLYPILRVAIIKQ